MRHRIAGLLLASLLLSACAKYEAILSSDRTELNLDLRIRQETIKRLPETLHELERTRRHLDSALASFPADASIRAEVEAFPQPGEWPLSPLPKGYAPPAGEFESVRCGELRAEIQIMREQYVALEPREKEANRASAQLDRTQKQLKLVQTALRNP